tara:strand:- start:451 stop:552 length:102 start_codon:yes stop_codon:yes gene_type:complete
MRGLGKLKNPQHPQIPLNLKGLGGSDPAEIASF